MQWEENRTNFDRNLAVVIGINRYSSNGIHDLKTAVSDASAIADLLEKEYAYKKTDIIRLLDGEATLTGLEDLLSKTIPNQLKPTSGDRLIFYYAGHGIPRNSKDGPAGYLVPQNADLNNADSFLPMQYVYEQLSQLACHHLLVILDCCFAGIFQWAGSRKLIPILETVRREHYDRFIRFPAWQVITSSAHDQEAMDVALDNVVLAEDNRGTVTNSSHSPFALALIEGLQDNRADLIPDGVVTAHELYLYLEQRVSELSKERQNPGLYPLRREYDRGEFIFTKPGFTRDQLKPAPPLDENNNPYRGLKSFDEKHAGFFFGRQVLIEELVKRLLVPNQPLAVVLGVSGSGKSSLVKAGLIPYLRDKQAKQWYILEPMRPGELPFTSLARVLLPVVNANLLEQLSQVSFLDEALKRVLEFKTEADQDLGRADQAKPESDRSFQMNETLIKVAQSWCTATPEARLLLVEDYLAQLEILCRPEERQLLVRLHDEILARLDSLLGHLQQDPQYLIAAIETWSQNHPNIKLLLVIDQFEELITASHEGQTDSRGSDETGGERTTEAKHWQPFLEMLRGAIAACPGQWRVVLTLRSDFEPRFLDSPLKSYWKDARFPVRAMNSDELRDAIEGPALKQALYFEPPELVGKLIDEVGQMPGGLPLLSFTLSELYIKLRDRWTKDNASDRALRIKDYEELGGVAGALTRRATEEYDNLVREFGEVLGKEYQATIRRVMLRMVTIEGGGVARRRVPESELMYPGAEENKRVAQVSDRLVKARLLVKGQETGEPYVEPAHDFLVRGWDKLQEWIKEEQGNLTLQQRLTPAASDWHNNERDTEYLWIRDPRLALLEKVLESKTNNWLNQLEVEFVEISKQKRLDELEETKRQLHISEERRLKAELREKATRVENLLEQQPLNSLVLAIHSIGLNLDKLPKDTIDLVQTRLLQVAETVRIQNAFLGHTGDVNSVALSPDGQIIVSGSDDGTIRLWDIQGNPISQPFTVNTAVNSVAFSPDGQMIVSGSSDKTVRLWDIQGNLLGQPFVGHNAAVNSVAFSPDGQIIASGSDDQTIRLWNILNSTKNFLQKAVSTVQNQWLKVSSNAHIQDLMDQPFIGHKAAVNSVAFSPDGQIIASASDDQTIRLWDIQGNLIIDQPFTEHEGAINCVTFSPDGRIIASGSDDQTIRLWKRERGVYSFELTLTGHTDVVSCIAFSPNGREIASGGRDYTIRLWDSYGNLIRQPLRGHRGHIRSVVFSSNSQMIASGSDDRTVHLWDNQNSSLIEKISLEHQETITSVAFSPDGQMIVSGSHDKTVCLWDLKGKLIGQPFVGHTNIVNSVAFSPDGQMIVSGSHDKTVCLWDLKGKLIGQPFVGHTNIVNSVAISPDGQMIVSGSHDKTVCLWDLKGKLIGQPFVGHTNIVNSVAISPDGQMIVSGSDDQTIRLWDIQGKLIGQPLVGHYYSVNSVAFSPDGQMIASGDGFRTGGTVIFPFTVRLWDLQGNPIGQPFTGHSDAVTSVAFSPDGQMIVSGSDDRTVCLWDIQGNRIGQAYRGHKLGVNSVAFSPDGQIIASGSNDKTIYLWQGSWQAWLATCCNRLRYHPIFKNPQTEIEKSACETCQKYVWNSYAVQLNELGAAKQKEKAFQAAIEDFNQALQFNPNHTNTYYTRGICYASLKNYQEAINDFNQAINFEKEYASAYYYRGMCHLKLNKHNKAIEDFQKAADFYEKQGQKDRYQDALDYIKRLQS